MEGGEISGWGEGYMCCPANKYMCYVQPESPLKNPVIVSTGWAFKPGTCIAWSKAAMARKSLMRAENCSTDQTASLLD